MSYVMVDALTGAYLQSYDPDWIPEEDPLAHLRRLSGLATWTGDLSEAMRFESIADARKCWARVSTRVPVRDDGRPNRPLTTYTVTIEKVG